MPAGENTDRRGYRQERTQAREDTNRRGYSITGRRGYRKKRMQERIYAGKDTGKR